MIALLKYGTGLPFNRLEGLQGSLGIPLPASTQWDIVHATAQKIAPVYQELIRLAAAGEVLYNDDTTMTILECTGKRAEKRALAAVQRVDTVAPVGPVDAADKIALPTERLAEDATPPSAIEKSPRKGVFTSGIVSTGEGHRIALFFTGHRHAGENLATVLAHRAAGLPPPIQMCDALSRNTSPSFKTILANCLAHGRRQFVDVVDNFPTECRYVLETLGQVYQNDATAAARGLSPQERLAFHRAESARLMGRLKGWMIRQLEERRVEPNSGLGRAIRYMLRHWKKLVLFLRVPGAPLDNNLCERILKMAILHRKNAMFYLTKTGAQVGDLFMSLIHTCRLNDVNPFDYLTALQRHAEAASAAPAVWMPWNHAATLNPANASRDD